MFEQSFVDVLESEEGALTTIPPWPRRQQQQLQLPGLVSPGMLEQGRGVRFMLWGKMSAAGS